MSVLCAPVAAAITFHNFHQCTGRPCTGTNGKNHPDERNGAGVPDEIYGRDGPDILRASDYGRDHDVVRSQGGGDRLLTCDGDTKDLAAGGRRGLRARAGGLRRPAHEHLAIFSAVTASSARAPLSSAPPRAPVLPPAR